MRDTSIKQIFFNLFLALSLTFISCTNGGDNGNGADGGFLSNKLQSNTMVAPLFGSSKKCFKFTNMAHVAWMVFDQSVDYQQFQVEEVRANRLIIPENPSPSLLLEDISSNSGEMEICVSYNPSEALESLDKTHLAYLLIQVDNPDITTVRLQLNGAPRGIAQNRCANVSDAEVLEYHLKDGTLDLYIVDPDAVVGDLDNDPDHANSSLTQVPMLKGGNPIDGTFTFYKVSDQSICISSAAAGVPTSIPSFDLPLPPVEGIPESVQSLNVDLKGFHEGVSTDGNIFLWETVRLDVLDGQIPLTPFTVTNGTMDPSSAQVPNFDPVPEGSGSFGDDEITIVGFSEILDTQPIVNGFGLDGALAVVELVLVKGPDPGE